jgi:DNA-binding CsgD family transcriptional regulator
MSRGFAGARAMDRDSQHLSDLVHQIYDASVHPERWNGVVGAIAASFGSSKGLMLTPYLGPQHGGLVFPAGISEADLQLWASRYIDKNVWAIGLQERGLWREGSAWVSDDMLPREQFLASLIYREFFRPQGIGQVCAGIVFAGSSDLPATALSIFRDVNDPEFDAGDIAWMKILTSHVSRSLGLMMRLDAARAQNASLLASFDRLNLGVALLDEQMRVIHLNRAAQTVMTRADGLFIDTRQQIACLPDAVWLQNQPSPPRKFDARIGITQRSSGLSGWLTDLRNAPITDPQHFMEGCTVARRSQRDTGEEIHHNRCYVLQCAPVPRLNGFGQSLPNDARQSGQVRFAVFITDPQAVQLPSPQRLGEIYGLTPTQANVAREFASGASYKQVARSLNMSEDTVRSHVKEIYPKTRVNRQSDLVRLVLSISTSGV